MSPASLAQLFDESPTTAFQLTLASGDTVVVDNPTRTLIADLELYIGQSEKSGDRIAKRIRIVSIPNITLIEKADRTPPNGRRRRR